MMAASLFIVACTVPRPGASLPDTPPARESCHCEGGAFPRDLTPNYQGHYLAMVIDSYTVNQELYMAMDRLQTFPPSAQIKAMAFQFASYTANEQDREAELTKELAVRLKQTEGWKQETVEEVMRELLAEYQGNDDSQQALTTFSEALTGASSSE